jgi:hypothetical protein
VRPDAMGKKFGIPRYFLMQIEFNWFNWVVDSADQINKPNKMRRITYNRDFCGPSCITF